jgi:uncharacterized coiled-coil protein SlyX
MLGNLKLMKFYETDRLALFDLSQDIQEQNDLAAERSADVEKMHDRMQAYLADIGAKLPVPNADYDPENPPPAPEKGKRGGGGKGGGNKRNRTGKGKDASTRPGID